MTVDAEAVSLTVGQDDILTAIRLRARGVDPARCSPTYCAARRVYGDRLIAACWVATRYVLLVEAKPSTAVVVELPPAAQAIEAAFDRLQPARFVLRGSGGDG
ncbi:MAG TPA: hypothetical protein VFD49_04130 [Candidatus Dormibacteraeota bacterium]|nr:hypothetical protein [Candidatus Dormibacteraeota bacterium]